VPGAQEAAVLVVVKDTFQPALQGRVIRHQLAQVKVMMVRLKVRTVEVQVEAVLLLPVVSLRVDWERKQAGLEEAVQRQALLEYP
jgi:hypothetical protein